MDLSVSQVMPVKGLSVAVRRRPMFVRERRCCRLERHNSAIFINFVVRCRVLSRNDFRTFEIRFVLALLEGVNQFSIVYCPDYLTLQGVAHGPEMFSFRFDFEQFQLLKLIAKHESISPKSDLLFCLLDEPLLDLFPFTLQPFDLVSCLQKLDGHLLSFFELLVDF